MELPCDFPEICAIAEVEIGTPFAVVLLKLISMIETLRRAKGPGLEVKVSFDRNDAGSNGLDKEGHALSREALRAVLSQKVRCAEQSLSDLRARLVALDEPQSKGDEGSDSQTAVN
jgi:hypothetical protein